MSRFGFVCFLPSDQNYVISFVVPNQKQLTALAAERGIMGSWEEICTHPDMERHVLNEIKKVAATSKGYNTSKSSCRSITLSCQNIIPTCVPFPVVCFKLTHNCT